ncbi:SdpA family antimicrobial peptide system protein [Lewinella sp. 4G2]|uniref:SdpA family antimicrobial peptide system protein n=1 Tax=Lewinella sp. 4G2 TaxID=1803372 RepID=UPI0007B4D558|nr:SdpA family antimicrobial peptide system protein [Lewinella sp. 4G2]OAV45727.1 hypothetical protein A3850_015045 [Lewinella sp. 4G2]
MKVADSTVLVATLVATGAIAALLVGSLFVAVMPFNPISPKLEVGNDLKKLFPEGWAFFTRNAREADHFIYRKSDQGWVLYDAPYPNAKAANYFGLNRRSRAASTEMVILMSQVPSSKWVTHELPFTAASISAVDTVSSVPLVNTVRVPMLCGELAIVRAKPIPWTYRRGGQSLIPEFDILFLTNNCEQP